jgi:autotransporter-associated beta strand protein
VSRSPIDNRLMRRTLTKLCHAVLAAGAAFTITPIAHAQIATLDKGHQLLVNSGLQIWGLNTDSSQYPFNYNNLTSANMNAVVWSLGQSNPGVLSAGQKWGKWVDYLGNPASALDSTENAHYADLVAIQVGDEQQSDIENSNGATKAWFNAAHNGNYFTDKLLYVNSTFVNDVGAFFNFIAGANPDAISWDAYPFGTTGVYPYNWLGKAQIYRRAALGSYIGASSTTPRPYGLYLQTYHGGDGARDPGDLEMRWQQFTAWTLGYTFVDAFTAGGGNTSLFNSGNGNNPTQPRYDQFKESARQSKNLGPALVKLISYGYGPNIILGKDSAGNTNPVPIDWPLFNKTNAPPNQQYLTSVSAQNLGTKNGGNPGDVYVGFFNPLLASYGDPAGTAYFMVTNALGAYLQDPSLLVSDCTQQITLDFDFGASTINSLQRLRRSDGQVEVVPLTHLSDNKYQLVFDLEGGTGDLFKYNDGTPFVGAPFTTSSLYWDSDGLAANNNLGTGAGLGGNGNWDTAASKWYNGTSNGPWSAGNDAIFCGGAGTATLSAPQSASSLTFKTTGYTVAGSTLTMIGPTITVDTGVTATISSVVAGSAGLIKNGPGTLNLAVNNSYTGGTTINEGVLGIVSGDLGANPAAPEVNVVISNGATLRFNQNNLTLTAQRQIMLGTGGAVIDTGFNNGILGVISGGALTKTGAGALMLSAINSHAATSVNGGAIVVASDENLGANPASFSAANITLDGGTLRLGADFDLSNNRGITLGASGGTIDTQGFTNPSGYTQANGISGSGNLTKVGSGTFYMNTPAGQLNTGWSGNLILKEGIWKITERGGLPFNTPSTEPVSAEQITFDGGTLQIGGPIPNVTNGRRGITVAAGGGTIDTQGFTFNWAGPLAGGVTSAVLTKIGSGTLQFNTNFVPAPATYAGKLSVAEGTLVINGGSAMGPLAEISLANAAGVSLTISGSTTTIGSLTGGGAAGGNVTLAASLVTGGNNNSTTFNGIVSGSGGLAKSGSGTFTLSGSNGYSGGTTINNGTLLVNNTAGSGTGTGAVVVNAGATLGGTGAIAGAVTVNAGAHIAPGASIESLDVGSLTLGPGSILDFELDTIMGVDTSDLINVTTANGLTINGGTLNLTNAGGMTSGSYTLINYSGTLNGSAGITLGTKPAGFSYGLVNNTSNKSIELVVTAPGDFNGDGRVDAADYVAWRNGLGSTYTQDDYDVWRAHYGQTAAGGSGITSSATTPEPTTWMLLFTGAPALFPRAAQHHRLVRFAVRPLLRLW